MRDNDEDKTPWGESRVPEAEDLVEYCRKDEVDTMHGENGRAGWAAERGWWVERTGLAPRQQAACISSHHQRNNLAGW